MTRGLPSFLLSLLLLRLPRLSVAVLLNDCGLPREVPADCPVAVVPGRRHGAGDVAACTADGRFVLGVNDVGALVSCEKGARVVWAADHAPPVASDGVTLTRRKSGRVSTLRDGDGTTLWERRGAGALTLNGTNGTPRTVTAKGETTWRGSDDATPCRGDDDDETNERASVLFTADVLSHDERLVSPDGRHVFGPDRATGRLELCRGNVSTWRSPLGPRGTALWPSLRLRQSGRLVLVSARADEVLWSTNATEPQVERLELSNDGRLRLVSIDGGNVWSVGEVVNEEDEEDLSVATNNNNNNNNNNNEATTTTTTMSCRPTSADVEYYCPAQRYCEWDSLPLPRRRSYANDVGYSRDTWNYARRDPVEGTTFSTLSDEQRKALTQLGFDAERHDCCLNHYDGYAWDDFGGYAPLIDALRTLGFTKRSWDNGEGSPTFSKTWNELTTEERVATRELCYTRETWDQVPLSEWPKNAEIPGQEPFPVEGDVDNSDTTTIVDTGVNSDSSSSSTEDSSLSSEDSAESSSISTTTTTTTTITLESYQSSSSSTSCRPSLPTDHVYHCPLVRYCPWDHYAPSERAAWNRGVGYRRRQWNLVERAPAEAVAWYALLDPQRSSYGALGYDEDAHDCCLNHYDYYAWEDFAGHEPTLDALRALGYDETSWDEGATPAATEEADWDDLTDNQQNAATELCYTRETWDGVALTDWSIDALPPGAERREDGASDRVSNVARAEKDGEHSEARGRTRRCTTTVLTMLVMITMMGALW